MHYSFDFETTAEIQIPRDPLEQVIGQDEVVKIAKLAAAQKRHLLLVAPPGTGKSMIAQAVAYHLSKPNEEISVVHNPENPERPFCEVRTLAQVANEKKLESKLKARLVAPKEVPSFVAERLGFRCAHCGTLSKARERVCPKCGWDKNVSNQDYSSVFVQAPSGPRTNRVHTTRLSENGREEVVVYERFGERVRILDQKTLKQLDALKKKTLRKIIVPFNRKTFVSATGASETELLGDVRHDPYGGAAGVGTLPYLRVVPGAIHEAHQGVLFIDEVSTLAFMQRFLLTAMQEKKYPIAGRNPQSAGASVRVDDVPCDFILIAASNINDLQNILPPLRSRIVGNGYEVLLETTMPATQENAMKIAQFTAQEIRKDRRIPHASAAAVEALAEEAKRKAKVFDGVENAFTLRLRELSGVIRLAGDLAKSNGSKLIEPEFISMAVKRGKNIEEQLKEKYGSVWRASASELSKEPRGDAKEIS